MQSLSEYESISGQQINKNKSSLALSPNALPEEVNRVVRITGINNKQFPIKYLGCPLYVGRKKISIFSEMIQKVVSKISGWQTKFLSTGAKVVLIKHVLMALHTHLLAAVHPPKGVITQIEKMLVRFFWSGSIDKKKYHWAAWDNLCLPYEEGGANIRNIQDICNAFTSKQWWNLKTGDSLWKRFCMAKYCQRSHPVIKKWYSGNSHSWHAMCLIKDNIDHQILWRVGKGDIAFWYDNWTDLGPLYKFLPEGARLKNNKVSEMIQEGEWNLQGWDRLLPEDVTERIYSFSTTLQQDMLDRPIWKLSDNGIFSVASAWDHQRRRGQINWIDKMTWPKHIPFKMCFTVWRALRDKLPTGIRVSKMRANSNTSCSCCSCPRPESIDHLFFLGDIAQQVWKHICSPLGMPWSIGSYKQHLIRWWKFKASNPISNIIVKGLPIITSWEIWKARCGIKYGNDILKIENVLHLISLNLSLLVRKQFHKIHIDPDWKNLVLFLNADIHYNKIIPVTWNKPTIGFVKVNTDGSCNEGACGGGGVVRDSAGQFIYAFSVKLGNGTSNRAEAAALLTGIKWCIANGFQLIQAEIDSMLLVRVVNENNMIPWRIQEEVENLKTIKNHSNFILKHCFREANQVANKLASLSHDYRESQSYNSFVDLPGPVKGLITLDSWNLPTIRTSKKRNAEITYHRP